MRLRYIPARVAFGDGVLAVWTLGGAAAVEQLDKQEQHHTDDDEEREQWPVR